MVCVVHCKSAPYSVDCAYVQRMTVYVYLTHTHTHTHTQILMQLKVAAETVQVASSASQRPTGTGDILSLGNGEVASQQQHSEDSTIVTQEV